MAKAKPKRASQDSSSGVLASLPAYARIVAWVGFPAAAAAYLIYVLAAGQSARLERMEQIMLTQDKRSTLIEQHLTSDTEQGWMLVGVLSRICLNTARTDDDKMACVAIARK